MDMNDIPTFPSERQIKARLNCVLLTIHIVLYFAKTQSVLSDSQADFSVLPVLSVLQRCVGFRSIG